MDKVSPKNHLIDRGLKPKKSFGQNFMIDQRVNQKLAAAVFSLGEHLPVVEIGAGTGSLTAHLLTKSPLVHAIERDRDLIPVLREQFADEIVNRHLILHEADGARFMLSSVITDGQRGILVGNLPYHLTSSIIILALMNRDLLGGAVFLVQKEVALRLISEPNHKQYGFLTAVLGLAFIIKKVADVDPSAFWPQPKVDSAIIQLIPNDRGISQVDDIEKFMFFVRAIFQKRRKKLSTILSSDVPKAIMIELGISPDLRPENLTPQQFLQLYQVSQRTAGDET